MGEEKIFQIRINIAFFLGVIISVFGIVTNVWWATVLGLLIMISVRMVELDRDEPELEN